MLQSASVSLLGKLLFIKCWSRNQIDDILSVNTQSAQTDQRRLRVGRWMIQSQSLDGQQLQSTDWILPRFRPSPPGQLPHRSPKARVLNADLLENPGAGIRGRLSKPSFAEVWLPHLDGSGEDSKYTSIQFWSQGNVGSFNPSNL